MLFVVTALSCASLGILITLVGVFTSLAIAFITIPKIAIFSLFGELSYSFYLIHVPIGGRIINLGLRLGEEIHLKVIILMIAIITSIFTAIFMYKYIEQPTQKWYKYIKYNL